MNTVATPVLLLTQDDFLWQHWRALDHQQWPLARGRELADLRRWREQRRTVAVIDADLPGLPALTATPLQTPPDPISAAKSRPAPSWQTLLNGMRAVIVSVRPGDAQGMQAFLSGALGYCHAYAPAETLANVLQAVTTGSVWMGASLVNRLLRQINALVPALAGQASGSQPSAASTWHHDALSEREHAIARHVAQGESNHHIATTLGISERTVKAHLTTIFEKLHIEDRLQLALIVHGVKTQT